MSQNNCRFSLDNHVGFDYFPRVLLSLLKGSQKMTQFTVEMVSLLTFAIGSGAKGTHLLYIKNGELKLERRTSAPVGDGLIAKITAQEIREGLTANRWNFVSGKLREYNDKHAA
jgi:hypothetical protein